MKHELIQQLLAAGFPRTDGTPDQFPDSGGALAGEQQRAPGLSELIAACPKEIGNATFVLGSGQGGRRWTATYFDFRNNRMVDDDTLCQSGDTPDEAVARLWLAVRK